MTVAAHVFTDAQKTDIRRYCGYPAYGDGSVVFPYPWIMKQYLALEYRLNHMTESEATVLLKVYLANLCGLEQAIPGTGRNLDTDQAAVWKHNANEQADRDRLFDSWRLRLCNFLGIPAGPQFATQNNSLVV